jgi:hypothetical protein
VCTCWAKLMPNMVRHFTPQLIDERVEAMVTLPAARDAADMPRDRAISLDWGFFFGQLSL